MDPVPAEDFHPKNALRAKQLIHRPMLSELAHGMRRDGQIACSCGSRGQSPVVLDGEYVIDRLLRQRPKAGQQHMVVSANFHGPEEHVVPQDLRLCGDPVMVTDGQKRIIPISQCQLVDGVPAADAERGVDVQASSVPLTGIRVGILDGHSLTPVLASKKMA